MLTAIEPYYTGGSSLPHDTGVGWSQFSTVYLLQVSSPSTPKAPPWTELRGIEYCQGQSWQFQNLFSCPA